MTRPILSNHPNFLQRTCLLLASLILPSKLCPAHTRYEFGNPTAEEQLYIEYINRARSNPAAEGIRLANTTDSEVVAAYTYFGLNRTLMKAEMSALPQCPPLAPNASLTTASRGHSQWMLARGVQLHTQTNPSSTISGRVIAAGFDLALISENISAYSKDVFYGHASFETDWGPGGTGGMQAGRGHRTNIHNPAYREIGVGVANGIHPTNNLIGPQLVTQNIGTRKMSGYFATGVAYFDFNSNNFYDIGEGLGGLTVKVSGSNYYCITAEGGGWSIPISASSGTVDYTITFSGSNLNEDINLTAPGDQNIKADLKLSYAPPLITSATTAGVNVPYPFYFSGVPGISNYEFTRWTIASAPQENCNSLAGVTMSLNAGYTGLNTTFKYEGAAAFQLTSAGSPNSQFIMLNRTYFGGNNPSFNFRSRLGTTTAGNLHRVQFQERGSAVWQDCYTQSGGSTESTFSLRTVSLPSLAGKAFKLRFLLSYVTTNPPAGYYPGTESNKGWMIDSIAFNNISSISNQATQTIDGTSAVFTPMTQGNLLLLAAPQVEGKLFPATSRILQVTALPPPPTFTSWATLLEFSGELPAGTLALNPNGDPDLDGIPTLIEYAFGTSPISSEPPSSRMPAPVENPTDYVFRYKRDKALTDIVLIAQVCEDLVSWKSLGQEGAPEGFSDRSITTSNNIETREVTIPKSEIKHCFLKIQVTRP